MTAKYVRQDLTYETFLSTVAQPAIERTKGVILDVKRAPTARGSLEKFYKAVAQRPDAVIRMGSVGIKVEGRGSMFDLWKLPGELNQYAVDVKDESFVAKTSPVDAVQPVEPEPVTGKNLPTRPTDGNPQSKNPKNRRCHQCHLPATYLCQRCKIAHYCSRECQKANWSEHKLAFCQPAVTSLPPDAVKTDFSLQQTPVGRVLVNEKGNHCIVQAMYNKDHAYEGKSLRLVAGSLGIGMGEPYFEYGGRDHGLRHFLAPAQAGSQRNKPIMDMMRKMRGGNDVHVWLEDGDGSVYDIADPNWAWVAETRGVNIGFTNGQIFEGMPKDRLQSMGLHYVPAQEEIMDELVHCLVERYKWRLDLLNIVNKD